MLTELNSVALPNFSNNENHVGIGTADILPTECFGVGTTGEYRVKECFVAGDFRTDQATDRSEFYVQQ